MWKRFYFGLALIAVLAYAAWTVFERRHHLRHLPEALGVTDVLYSAEKTFGFGPGGNETGIIFYGMPEATAEALQDGGLDWLAAMSPNSWSGRQGRFATWHPTPPPAEGWATPGPKIRAYLDRYGFGIPFDGKLEEQVDRALSAPGAFYAHGRTGMILLIPEQLLVVYAYAG